MEELIDNLEGVLAVVALGKVKGRCPYGCGTLWQFWVIIDEFNLEAELEVSRLSREFKQRQGEPFCVDVLPLMDDSLGALEEEGHVPQGVEWVFVRGE